jgi:hypothetical protein
MSSKTITLPDGQKLRTQAHWRYLLIDPHYPLTDRPRIIQRSDDRIVILRAYNLACRSGRLYYCHDQHTGSFLGGVLFGKGIFREKDIPCH